MDNKTLTLFQDSLKQVEAEITRLTEKAVSYREAIKTEEERRVASKARRQKANNAQAQGPGQEERNHDAAAQWPTKTAMAPTTGMA